VQRQLVPILACCCSNVRQLIYRRVAGAIISNAMHVKEGLQTKLRDSNVALSLIWINHPMLHLLHVEFREGFADGG
jgi:hypothetical protein